ncbi:MAG: NAD(P)/FAD-dependent oxidoreductase [Tumebacillaceae bacterium]
MTKILIVGAGYGGVATAVGLEKHGQPFTLVNKHDYHYFTTLMHETAGGRSERYEDYKADLTEILRADTSRIVVDTVQELRPQENKVVGEHGTYDYDYCVVALGNAPEYFGIPGMQENALVLRSLETSKQIHEHIEKQFASFKEDGDERKLKIIVGGAGLTGIELCGELAETLPELAMYYDLPLEKVELINLEAAPTILPMLDEKLRERAADILDSKGVQLRTGTAIVKVNPNQVELKTGETLDAMTIIWTGGVRANPLIKEAGFETDNKGRAKVNEFLQSVDFANVFVIGDSAWFIGPDGKPLAPTAQAAEQMGTHLVTNLLSHIKGQSMVPFTFNNLGTLASLGQELGVGSVKGMATTGVPASLMKEATKVKYLWHLGGMRMLSKKRGQLSRRG